MLKFRHAASFAGRCLLERVMPASRHECLETMFCMFCAGSWHGRPKVRISLHAGESMGFQARREGCLAWPCAKGAGTVGRRAQRFAAKPDLRTRSTCHNSHVSYANTFVKAAWSSGMILGLGPRGPGFNSRSSPLRTLNAHASSNSRACPSTQGKPPDCQRKHALDPQH